MRNYSESCQRNQQPIFDQLQPWLEKSSSVLEVGSGSGQHAIYFSQRVPHLSWQCSDREMWLADLAINLQEAHSDSALVNLPAPIKLDVNGQWPVQKFDLIYTANSLHIMGWESVQALFRQLDNHLNSAGVLCCYGPFKYQGEFTSASNANFDDWLKQRDSESGVREFAALHRLAQSQNLQLISDTPMPANNQLLVWQKR
ncbi:MAG: hypothetical protein OFPII_36830 [Osedax symbiont Rs1]|nr:MAG: hypothetical protein OFPII_36830 [Osedax symbiont Rs1]